MSFIVFEGLDGSGKTTQIKRVNEDFAAKGLPCVTTLQPSNSRIGKLARAATFEGLRFENETLALLFSAEHYQHYCDVIAPAIASGKHVLCDRYYYSNLAYQGTESAIMERILAYNQAVMNPPAKKPDTVIFLDVEPEECLRRITSARTKISIFETLERLKLQRERYFAAFHRIKETENIIIIESTSLDKNSVFEKIMNKINSLCLI